MERIRRFFNEFSALPKKCQLGVAGILFATFIFGFIITIFYWRTRVPKPPTLPPVALTPAPKRTSFTLVPQKRTLKLGETFVVSINFDSGRKKVDAADVVLSFNPKVLKVEKLSPGIFFADYPVMKTEKGKINITGSIGVQDQQKGGVSGVAPFANVTFTTIASGRATVSFDKVKTIVVYQGKPVPVQTQGGEYTIN